MATEIYSESHIFLLLNVWAVGGLAFQHASLSSSLLRGYCGVTLSGDDSGFLVEAAELSTSARGMNEFS